MECHSLYEMNNSGEDNYDSASDENIQIHDFFYKMNKRLY